jgi:hypothetical protein
MTIPIDGKEYDIGPRSTLSDGREKLTLIEVPKKPAPLQEWAVVNSVSGAVFYSYRTRTEAEGWMVGKGYPDRIARIVEVPENARKIWVVTDRGVDHFFCAERRSAEERVRRLRLAGGLGPHEIREFIEVSA